MVYAIETIDLTKNFGSLVAVNKLNLKVQKKSVHGFLGPNGAGKSTTIKLLVGLLKPTSGAIKILDKTISIDQANTRLHIGYMPELPKFPKHLRGRELLDIYSRIFGMNQQQRAEQIPRLIEMVGLKGRENDFIGKYSKGMQQRIGIAQALINNPELVILDEPSTGLDPVGMVEVRELIKNIAKEGATVLIASHLLAEVEQICSHITIINQGVSIVSDTIQNISGASQEHSILQIELDEPRMAVVTAVKKLPYVTHVSQNNNKLTISLKNKENVRAQISQAILDAGGLIVSMNVKESLEDVYLRAVSNTKEKTNNE